MPAKKQAPIPRNEIERLIIETWPESPEIALAVAYAESGMNPHALNANDSHSGCNGSYGVFQIGCLHETNPDVLFDAKYNIKRAREIYDSAGSWQPWGAHTNGSFRAYLTQR